MPCRNGEQFAQGPEDPNPVTPLRLRHNAMASHDESNAEEPEENDSELDHKSDEDKEAGEASDKPKRHRELKVYATVKRWVTGE